MMIKATGNDSDVLLQQHTKTTDRVNDDLIELQDKAYSLGREHSEKQINLMKEFILNVAEPSLKGLASDYPDSASFQENLVKLEELKAQMSQ